MMIDCNWRFLGKNWRGIGDDEEVKLGIFLGICGGRRWCSVALFNIQRSSSRGRSLEFSMVT